MSNKEESNFRTRRLIFIDLETTGLDKNKHEILEIGCLLVDGESFEIIEEFSAKVKPKHIKTANPEALKINGYTKEKWKNAKDVKEVLEKVASISDGAMVAGWHICFDWEFIEMYFKKLKIESSFNYHQVDVQSIAYAKLYNTPQVKSMRLRNVAGYFGFDMSDVHSAGEDIKITYKVFKKLMKFMEA